MRYWIRTLLGLAITGASIVAFAWALYHIVRTGTCASGGPYVSTRPCPPGTAVHIVTLIGAVFAGIAGLACWAARGADRAGRLGLTFVAVPLAGCSAVGGAMLGAFGPAALGRSDSRTAAIIVAVVLLPLSLGPLLLAPWRRRPLTASPLAAAAPGSIRMPAPTWLPPASRPAPPAEDHIAALERLAGLRDRGALTPEEFEREKRRLLGEG